MTQQELSDYLTDWVKDYCHNPFEDGIPSGVTLFVTQASDYLLKQNGITSESLGDYSVSISPDFPPALTNLLRPYRRLRTL